MNETKQTLKSKILNLNNKKLLILIAIISSIFTFIFYFFYLISVYLKKRLSKNKVFDFSYQKVKGSVYMYCKVHCRFIVQT